MVTEPLLEKLMQGARLETCAGATKRLRVQIVLAPIPQRSVAMGLKERPEEVELRLKLKCTMMTGAGTSKSNVESSIMVVLFAIVRMSRLLAILCAGERIWTDPHPRLVPLTADEYSR
ncbi:hypothetical protein Tco_1193268 [Tanacetum coccineum]